MEEVAEAPAAQPMEVKPPVVLEQPPTEAMEVEQQTQQHQQQPSPQKQIQREPETPPQHHPEFEQDEGMEFKNNIRGGFRGRPWNMGGGPPRFRGRGFGPGGPGPMRGRGGPGPFFRGRGGPQGGRFPGPNFDPNWGPNNMGGPGFNPPGFGNPPLELWVETKSEDGKSYFYHAISRETTWTRPEGPNIKIMTQADVEAMNARNQQQQPPQQQQQPQQHPPPQQQQPQQQQPPNQAASENSAKEPQQANANGNGSQIPPNKTPPVTKEGEISESAPNSVPVNNGIAKPVEPIPTSMPPPMQQPPAFFPGAPPHFGAPPFGMPPPGYGGYPPGAWGVPWGVPNAHMQEPPAKNLIIKPGVIDPAVIARAAEWSEHRAPDGRPYYYHAGRGESVWEKPQAIRDLEAARMAAHSGATPQSIAAQTSGTTTVAIGQAPIMSPAINMGPGTPFDPMAFAPKPGDPNLMKMEANELAERDKKKKEQEKKKKEEEEKNKQANKPQDKSRPISSTPIAGTPWCVVWTGDGRVFFYNPSTRTSVWERPEDLLARADVDKAVSTPPEQLLGTLEKEKKPETQPPIEISTNKVEIESITEDEAPNKKLKLSVNEGKPVEKKVDVAKEAAIEAEVRAAKERALVPLDVRVKSFKEMLKEKDVSAFSTWEKELHKIVFDPRYLLLTSRERKQVFEKYVKERAEEERKEKRNKMRQKREDFRKLMEEANLHGKSSFSDFSQRYGKDDRYKAIEKVRERESLFNEFIVEVRRREKEEKLHKKEVELFVVPEPDQIYPLLQVVHACT